MQPAGSAVDGSRSLAASALQSATCAVEGRDEELAMLRAAVRADGTRPLVLALYGGAGVGKTMLAVIAHLTAVVENRPSTFVPASYLARDGAGAIDRLESLGLSDGFASLGWGPARQVLVIDAFEHIHAISGWFFAELLAAAGANLSVIITSRRPLSAALAPFATMIDIVEVELPGLETAGDDPLDPAALRQTLSTFDASHLLEDSPLAQRFDGPSRVEACRHWLRSGIEELARCPTHADLADVLEATYLQGAIKQRVAAADLNLPWGTYRHRLRRALDALADVLTRSAPRP